MIDMWYKDKPEDVDNITASFSDIDCEYRGNLYIKGKIVGDFTCNDSVKLEKWFPQFYGLFDWDNILGE